MAHKIDLIRDLIIEARANLDMHIKQGEWKEVLGDVGKIRGYLNLQILDKYISEKDKKAAERLLAAIIETAKKKNKKAGRAKFLVFDSFSVTRLNLPPAG